MTDRLASCRKSPNGKHDRMAYTINGKTACRYCGRIARYSAVLDAYHWTLEVVGKDPEPFDGTATQV